MGNKTKSFFGAFDSYAVLRQIGSGGSGIVFEVQTSDGQNLAVKVLDKSKTPRQKVKRFHVWQTDHPQHSLDPTTGTEQFQATALTGKGNIRPGDGADARAIQLCHIGQVQQQLPHSVGDQLL